MEEPFAPSLFVEIRKRMGQDVFEVFHGAILDSLESAKAKRKAGDLNHSSQPGKAERSQAQEDNKDDLPSDPGSTIEDEESNHQGKLILDATVAPQAIRYPTDLSLLNEAREFSEQIIDTLYPKTGLTKKPRTYREKARKAFLAIVKHQATVAVSAPQPGSYRTFTRALAERNATPLAPLVVIPLLGDPACL